MKLDNASLLAFDPTQSQQIHGNLTEAESLKVAAAQFEAIFLQLVLKSMHATTEAMASEHGMFSGREQELFRDMYDAQLAQSMAGSGQLGLADSIVRQLGESLSRAENKFNELASSVAMTDEEGLAPVEIFPSPAFSQPLLPLQQREERQQ